MHDLLGWVGMALFDDHFEGPAFLLKEFDLEKKCLSFGAVRS